MRVTDTLYRKQGRRYYPVGMEFAGFPADGYWQVLNGRQSLIVPASHPRPLEAIRYHQYANRIVLDYADKNRQSWSLMSAVEFTLNWLEKEAHAQGELPKIGLATKPKTVVY